MKVIKNINNNVSICLDGNNKEVIVFGKGIGFKKPPFEVDLKDIQKTYYNLDPMFINMINSLDENIIDIADDVVEYAANNLDCVLNNNIVFTLADHLAFAIKRHVENIKVTLPIINDIEHLFEQEIDVGYYALDLINKVMNIKLPKQEAAYIALNIINSEYVNHNQKSETNEKIINDITNVIESHFGIEINKNDFNYSRFVSHMHYLLKREENLNEIKTENKKLFQVLKKTYKETYDCATKIKNYLSYNYKLNLNDEECLYLILHINRLCAREDCYR